LLAGAESITMQQWKLILAYDGTPYHGWQVQPGLSTIQGLLADAVHRTTGERVLPQGSGRTDAGVHALGQVASFSLAAPIPPANLQRALNRCLPPSIRILSADVVPTHFHARHSALRKTYEYRIFPLRQAALEPQTSNLAPRTQLEPVRTNICPPTLAPYVWPCPWPLSLDALNQAACHILGAHDFTSFATSDPDLAIRAQTVPTGGGAFAVEADGPTHWSSALTEPRTAIRTIIHSQWHVADRLFLYRVTANGFLHHMVRNLVGTFVQAGAQRLSPDSIPALLAARNRTIAGPTAPASGLFLVEVEYPTDNLHPATGTSL
jgi:tRNA pseudouridine38-40 synthase